MHESLQKHRLIRLSSRPAAARRNAVGCLERAAIRRNRSDGLNQPKSTGYSVQRNKNASEGRSTTSDEPADFSKVYRMWYMRVRRWAASLGASWGDVDDVTQEVFIIVRRKLPAFHAGNLAGWLFRITERTVWDFRRQAWFRHTRSRSSPDAIDGLHQEIEELAVNFERKESLAQLQRILARISRKRRETFLLFAVLGYTGEEIAAHYGIPVATVWTRLYQARRELARLMGIRTSNQARATLTSTARCR
jgi:RNA polymerase sigma-70 factor (ECF subfamily)